MIDPTAAEDAARMMAVHRAAGELRRGSFVLIEGAGGAAIAQAAEAATRESLATLIRLANGHTSLALTAERASVLNLPTVAGEVVTVPLAESVDLPTLRALVDATYGDGGARLPETPGLAHPGPDSCASAAIRLSKLAQLLPAAVTAPLPAEALARLDPSTTSGGLLRVAAGAIAEYPRLAADTLRPVSEARVPLAAAEDARVVGFRPADGSIEHFAILVGHPGAHQPALCRLHSECFTGDLLGSLRCDCGPQLQAALEAMGRAGHGVLLYLAQEGRGIGLINKLRAYRLQDAGLDTVDANRHLGFEPDERSFRAAAVMLRQLGIERVHLLTNNPRKVEALAGSGVEVIERVPLRIAPNRHNRVSLATKAQRSGHLLER